MIQTATVSDVDVTHGNHDDADYDAFLARVQTRFLSACQGGQAPLFTTDAAGLFNAYLASFGDGPARQYHNCHACRLFIERFGGLVTIDSSGRTAPAVWYEDDAPEHYRPAVAAMARVVRRAKVTGVFLSAASIWGSPETGPWRHFAVTPPAAMVFKRGLWTAGQAMAEKREDFKTVSVALGEFTLPVIDQALTLLRSEALYRSEKVIGQAEWLRRLHVERAAVRGTARANVAWRFVATAPAGFCHPRSSMIGTLLEDIAAGMDFGEVSRRFAAKMHPLQYQRPQAAPTSGAIAAAEKLVAELGAAGSLARRFARLDEIQALWTPAPIEDAPAAGGVFGHLQAKGTADLPAMKVPPQKMTWEKLARTVLPTATRIEIRAPHRGGYSALVTAENLEAPPILQWDSEEQRNPVSWYFWAGGSPAGQFGLTGGAFYPVAAITLKPCMWNGGFEHQGVGVMLVIEGARDSRQAGAALFPESLRSEYHGVRSVIEAYSRAATLGDAPDPLATGYMLTKGDKDWDVVVRVWSGGLSADYMLDRWD